MQKVESKKKSRSKKKQGASASGYHFYNLYQNCPRKFYLQYVCRLVPEYTFLPLIFGTMFHEGKATFYKTGSGSKAHKRMATVLKGYVEEIDTPEAKEFLEYKLPILLDRWIVEWGAGDIEYYEFVAVEKELKVELKYAPGMYVTMRQDAVVRDPTEGVLKILETKTSQSSINTTLQGVENGDQATTYLWGARKYWKDEVVSGVIPDIAYWHKSTNNIDNIQCVRGIEVLRSERDLEEFEQGVAFLFHKIALEVGMVLKGEGTPLQIFPRNTQWCTAYFRRCEYMDVCRNCDISLKGRAPMGFKRDRNSKERKIGSHIYMDTT